MAALREDLVLASRRGLLQRVAWMDARFKSHFTIELASVPFSTDLQQSRGEGWMLESGNWWSGGVVGVRIRITGRVGGGCNDSARMLLKKA